MDTLSLPRPDDFHLHLRDGDVLRAVLPATSAVFARAIAMPNLRPPVQTTAQAAAYRDRILAAVPPEHDFTPLMTLYLTDQTDPSDVRQGLAAGVVHAVKLYPAGATTNSDAGVRSLDALDPVLEALAELGAPLLVHGEVTDPDVDVFDREAVFIERHAIPMLERHPSLRMVFEHATTAQAVDFVKGFADGRVAATLTPQHLLMDRNALFEGGLRPHHYCLPVLKRRTHREALVAAAISGDPRFFLGTDSAPHAMHLKESACGCAGCYTAPHAMALYATVFDAHGALDRLPDFASRFGARFYGLPENGGAIRLIRQETRVPDDFPLDGDHRIVPLLAGEYLPWRVEVD